MPRHRVCGTGRLIEVSIATTVHCSFNFVGGAFNGTDRGEFLERYLLQTQTGVWEITAQRKTRRGHLSVVS